MFARWSVHGRPGLQSRCIPRSAGQDQSLSSVSPMINRTSCGRTPGYRIRACQSIIVTGTFAPSRGATSLSRAPHLGRLRHGHRPLLERKAASRRCRHSPDRATRPRPFASSCERRLHDIVATRTTVRRRTGEDFAAFLRRVPRPARHKHRRRSRAFLGTHPAAMKL